MKKEIFIIFFILCTLPLVIAPIDIGYNKLIPKVSIGEEGNVTNYYNVTVEQSNYSNYSNYSGNANTSAYWDNLNSPLAEWSSITNTSYYLGTNPSSFYNSTTFPDSFLLNTGDTGTGNYTLDSPTFHVNSVNHRVGIGTTSPITALANTAATVDDGITTTKLGAITWTINSTGPAAVFSNSNTSQGSNALLLKTAATGGLTYGLKVMAGTSNVLTTLGTGNVGIGTILPQQKLHVNGNILTNGTFIVNGSLGINGNYLMNGSASQCWLNFTGGLLTASSC